MDNIQHLFDLNITYIVLSLFIIMSGAIAIYNIIGKFSEIVGKPVKWVKKKNEYIQLVKENAKAIKDLAEQQAKDVEQSKRHDQILREDLSKLTNLFTDKLIDDLRYEILDFASSLSSGRKYNKEQFNHIIKMDEKYKRILEEHNMENGQVTVSMQYINEVYKEKLKNGFED